ncbi:MAG: alpha/beta hydrolase family protein, partial [Mycobacteriales bacterium]
MARALTRGRRLAIAAALVLAAVPGLATVTTATASPATTATAKAGADRTSQPPRCARVNTAGEPTNGRSQGPPAPRYFAADFPHLADDLWGYPLGGFGGLGRQVRPQRTPVIFVHGNQVDAQNWLDVMQQFQNDAGYTMADMFALSYNGLENYYAGAPDQVAPTALDQDYLAQNSNALANGGHGSADDDEVFDLCRFIEAVQAYTGSPQVDIVAHSLGVTLTRDVLLRYPALARDTVAAVMIAGANQGTTVCRGLASSYYGCNEIAPGTPWLAWLNGPNEINQGAGPTRWMTIYDGSAGDPFFDPPLDQSSPHLLRAVNVTFPGTYHNDLRVDPAEVDTYLPFLLRAGQAGPWADPLGAATAARIQAAQPDGLTGQELCGIPALTGPVAGCPATPAAPAAPAAPAGASAAPDSAPAPVAPAPQEPAVRTLAAAPRALAVTGLPVVLPWAGLLLAAAGLVGQSFGAKRSGCAGPPGRPWRERAGACAGRRTGP